MDIIEYAKKYWWTLLLGLYIVSVIIKFNKEGPAGLATVAGISLLVAIVQTIANNSRNMKRAYRYLKYFIGFGTFVWDTNAKFLVRGTYRLSDHNAEIKKFVEEALKQNNIKYKHDDIEVSADKLGRIKIYVSPLSVYLSLDVTDAEQRDDEGFALFWLNIRARTSLRYKNMNKVINGFLIDYYKLLDDRYGPVDQKYTVKVNVEGMAESFLKEQFIKEFSPSEVTKFTIMVKSSRSNQEITEKQISVTTNRREELVNSVKDLLLRLS